MFRGAVLALLAALACQAQGDCIKSFRIANKLKEIKTSWESLDWYSMNDRCEKKHSEASLIRSINNLSASDRKLCKGGVVPIGVEKFGGQMYPYGGDLSLSNNDLPASGNDNQGYEYGKHYGTMDLTTGSIHFTYHNATFKCALCRYDEDVKSLDPFADSLDDYSDDSSDDYDNGSWREKYYKHYIVKVTSVGKRKRLSAPTEKDLKSLGDEITLKLASIKDYSGEAGVKDVVFKSSKANADGSLELVFHFLVDTLNVYDLPMASFQDVQLDGNYQMSVVENTVCAEEQMTDEKGGVTAWTSDDVGSVQTKVNLTSWLAFQRTCKFDNVTDMPKWDAPRVWQIIHEPCSEFDEYVNNITHKDILGPSIEYNQQHQLQKFTESPVDAKTLGEVARLTSREIRAAKELTSEMHDDLRKILVALQTNGQAVTIQEPRVNFVVADLINKSQAVNGFTMTFQETGLGQVVEPILLAVNRKALPNQVNPRPTVSLTVSDDIVGGANKIAFAAFWKPMNSWEDDKDSGRSLEVEVILAGPKVGLSSYKSFIDIAYQLNEASGATNVSCGSVVDGNSFIYTSYYGMDDSSVGCKYLESVRKSEILCRCETKYFTAQDGIFNGTFSFKETLFQPNYYQSYNYYPSYKPDNDTSFNVSSSDSFEY